jgi:pantoate--beta-alanine ligase
MLFVLKTDAGGILFMATIIQTPEECIAWRAALPANHRLALIATRGWIHSGHESLITKALEDGAEVVVSLFVSKATQHQDLNYDNDQMHRDIERLKELGVHAIFQPSEDALFADYGRFVVRETLFSQMMEGKTTPGYFDAALTTMLRLLHLVRPSHTYMGEKDYQYYLLVRDMARSFFLPVEVVVCPTIRDERGLPLSVRHHLLNDQQLEHAAMFTTFLTAHNVESKIVQQLEEHGFVVEYVQDYKNRRYAAVTVGGIRLVDSVPLQDDIIH